MSLPPNPNPTQMPEEVEMEGIVLELGDIATLYSSVFGSITGKVIYRDELTIRVRPLDVSDRAIDLALAPDGDFSEATGVNSMTLHTKRDDPYFSVQLGVNPGERLDFYTIAGEVAAPPGVVAAVGDAEGNDVITLTDGRKLDFAFVGPPAPIAVISVSAAEGGAHDEETDVDAAAAAAQTAALPADYDISLLDGLIPAAMVEDIPSAEVTYSEDIQREDMFDELLKDYKPGQQKNPAILRRVARETELLIALKTAATTITDDEKIRPYIKSAETLGELLTQLGSPISSIIPVIAAKRILYTNENVEERLEAMLAQVEFRDWVQSELRTYRKSTAYLAGQEVGGAAQIKKLMYEYLYDVLFQDGNVFLPSAMANEADSIKVDQDVMRTVAPPEPILGYSQIPKEAKLLSAKNVGPIVTRKHRVIAPYTARTGELIAPGDPGTALNYVLLPSYIGTTYRPVKFSGNLAEDIRAGDVVTKIDGLENYTNKAKSYGPDGITILKGTEASEGDDAGSIQIHEWVEKNLNKNVHQSDMLNPASVGVSRVLDSIGLRSYEWTPSISKTIWKAIGKAQSTYDKAFESYVSATEAYLKKTKAYSVGPCIPEDSDLYTRVMAVPEIAAALNKLKSFDAKADWDLAKAQYLLNSAEGTMARVLYMASASTPHPKLKEIRDIYVLEAKRGLLAISNLNKEMAKLKAAPVINKCPHVHDKEILRSVMKRDENKFLGFLQKFLQKYQGKRTQNWVECKVCSPGQLICMHEVMLFYERTHPGRADALHKEILLEYGGAGFNGKYVCRNCGVPIADFEYDTHLEFDDEGRPLVGRAVVQDEEERSAEDELDSILNMSIKKKSVVFEDPVKQELYDIARILVQSAGFNFEESTYRHIVDGASHFTSEVILSREDFAAQMARVRSKKTQATYESIRASTQICAVLVFVLFELHTLMPLPELMFPFQGCQFKRGGFPIESENDTDLGALNYLVCTVANLNRNTEPWNMAHWASDMNPNDRQKKVNGGVLSVLADPNVNVILIETKAKYNKFSTDMSQNASEKDVLPFTFRPVRSMTMPNFEGGAPTYPDRIVRSAIEAPLAEIIPIVGARTYELAVGSIINAHTNAKASGIFYERSERSDSTCCFVPIQDARAGTISVFVNAATNDEIVGLRQAEKIYKKRDPTEQSNGTHLWVKWTMPQPIESKPVPPDSAYFKLFMRTCYTGPREGLPHEFGRRAGMFECRHCRFQAPRNPLVLMSDLNDEENDNNNAKAKVLKTVIQDEARNILKMNNVTVNADTFDALLTAVRNKRMVNKFTEPSIPVSMDIYEALKVVLTENSPLLPTRKPDLLVLHEIMKANFERTSEATEEARIISWGAFQAKVDTLKAGLVDLLEGRQGRGAVRQASRWVESMLETIERLIDDPIFQGPNEVRKHWIVGLERLAQRFNEQAFVMDKKLYNGEKWFGKNLSTRHASKFQKAIQDILTVNADTNKDLQASPEIRAASTILIQQVALWLSRVMDLWSDNIGLLNVSGLTVVEKRLMLQWIVMSTVETLLSIESPIYTHITSEANKTTIQRILVIWVRKTFVEARHQFDQFSATDAEIKQAMIDAVEREKISVIKEIEDENDPDLKALMKIQKGLKMGRWGVGTAKNLASYNASFWDFLQDQRDKMGIVDTTAVAGGGREDALGFNVEAAANAIAVGDSDAYARQDEDEGGDMY